MALYLAFLGSIQRWKFAQIPQALPVPLPSRFSSCLFQTKFEGEGKGKEDTKHKASGLESG